MKTPTLPHQKLRYGILLLIGLLFFATSCNQTPSPLFLQENDRPCLITYADAMLLEQYKVSDSLLVQYLQEIQHEVEQIEQLLVEQAKSFRQQQIILYRVIFAGCVVIALLVYIYLLQRQQTRNQAHIVQQYEAYLQNKKETRKENGGSNNKHEIKHISCSNTKPTYRTKKKHEKKMAVRK